MGGAFGGATEAGRAARRVRCRRARGMVAAAGARRRARRAVPAHEDSDFQLRVGVNALLLAMLALGLNVAVGWAGLLDLGYIAFYGFGAYGYALLSSDQLGSDGIHLSAALSIPLIMVAAAALGMLLGLPSRRLWATTWRS